MTDNSINAFCAICGKGYHVCNTCLEQKAFKPWRTVVDSIEHYKIYLAIHGYTISKDKDTAKNELSHCDLSDLESFKPEIKNVIREIMKETKKTKVVSNNNKRNIENKTDDVNE